MISMTTTDTTTQIPTPRMDKAAGKPSHDWEKTAERLYAERVKLERELHDARRHALNIYQDQCENAYVEASVADAFRQALAEVAPDHPALKGAPPSFGVWEKLDRENGELISALSVREDENDGLEGMLKECRAQNEKLHEALESARAVLDDIHILSHCFAKAGPLNTPTLDDAWSHFMRISAMATAGLRRGKESQ